MMPMSPDDYKALSQYVSPRDIDAVVSVALYYELRNCVLRSMLLSRVLHRSRTDSHLITA